eukprot:CAMPEP_0206474684 /NCGR_PEP_ID=MMETSP0324_2-20121206/33631_1 /ASSEMBLY_ACC=CAM_ASM_000836 /TAXON_ID=2866 /ORGANISM="Crypthecodinium cohnii, Strain Seligo" /LENGTH=516 /DNA_ID=CAMNT_0053949899 /DNA_START=146 /DNA_END=1696 /DNA_ORIENTATION=-
MDIATAEAFADVGAGRKAWRQLRAVLKLENDTLEALLMAFIRDTAVTSAAILRVFSESAASEILVRLAAQASVEDLELESKEQAASAAAPESAAAAAKPNAGSDGADGAGREASSPSASACQSAGACLAAVWAELPRLPPGKRGAITEGHEERRRALRRRMQTLLPAQEANAIKTANAELRTQGPSYARLYIEIVWSHLATREDAVEMLVALIRQQSDTDIQVALRAALSELTCTSWMTSTPPSSSKGSEHRDSGVSISLLDDMLLTQVLSFLAASASDLASSLASSRSLFRIAAQDDLWRVAEASLFPNQGSLARRRGSSSFSEESPALPLPLLLEEKSPTLARRVGVGGRDPVSVRMRCLSRLASRCVECGISTSFEHCMLGWRLCEACEKCHSRYALIRSAMAMTEYQLPERMLLCLPSLDGTTGRVYLRAAVEDLAARLHSREDLQKLRSRNDVGISSAGRQRGQPTGKSSNQSAAREFRNRGRADPDPCCYEATALRKADITESGWHADMI